MKNEVDFSDRTAQKFMKIYNEFGKTNAPSFLSTEKLWLMLGVPQEQREEFISQSHEINGESKTVDEMTTRELISSKLGEKKHPSNRCNYYMGNFC